MTKGVRPGALVVRVDPGLRRDDGDRVVVTHTAEAARVALQVQQRGHARHQRSAAPGGIAR